MITAILIVLGLALGSFVNALVWRVHEQDKKANKNKQELSVLKGRSMCPNCRHKLAGKDLVPLLSWLSLGGKCRYCKRPIPVQYPLVEVSMALMFVASYLLWPVEIRGLQAVVFAGWLLILTGLAALLVYDLRWKLLPNRIVYPLSYLVAFFAALNIIDAQAHYEAFTSLVLGVVVGGGIFYVIFQISKGKWIGGGDVKLGWLLGAIVASPTKSFLFIFLAALLGSFVSIPLLYSKRLKRDSTIPFGPLLIIGAVIAFFFGSDILDWYRHTFLIYS